jgi:hypothetical protein
LEGFEVADFFKKAWDWLNTESGMLVACVLFLPLGIILVFRSKRFSNRFKNIFTGIGVLLVLIFVINAVGNANVRADYGSLQTKHTRLTKDFNDTSDYAQELSDDKDSLQTKYDKYKEKMQPYESLSKADAAKRKRDAAAAQTVSDKIDALPAAEDLKGSDEGTLKNVRKLYNALTAEQKKLVDITALTELENKLPDVKKKEAAAAAAKKKAAEDAKAAAAKKAEEERRGYETGITYDQLARTPDSYQDDKVKFSGKVLQVMEDDDSSTVNIRLAVGGDYDNVLLGVYSSYTVSKRVLEDDYITVYGTSNGLTTYESTMGGDITIPEVQIDKISQ